MLLNDTLVPYQLVAQDLEIGGVNFKIFVIEDLNTAIDDICQLVGEESSEGEDLCPYFGKIWNGGMVLASYLDKVPLAPSSAVLELGCGLALPSFVLSKKGHHVLATDFHPDVPKFLELNLKNNNLQFAYQNFDWKSDKLDKKYDLIVGSDILYDASFALYLAQALDEVLLPGGKIILADPGRLYFKKFVDQMEKIGFHHESHFFPIEKEKVQVITFIKGVS